MYQIVCSFKDYLFFDDPTEFMRSFHEIDEAKVILSLSFKFY